MNGTKSKQSKPSEKHATVRSLEGKAKCHRTPCCIAILPSRNRAADGVVLGVLFSSPSVTFKRLWLAAMAIPRAIACCEGGQGARTAENYKYQEK
jgi:hypothetical protein